MRHPPQASGHATDLRAGGLARGPRADRHAIRLQAAREARRRGHDGVVCGHIHRAEMRVIDGVLYCNDGDWVESRTALVEHHDGRLELVRWVAAEATQSVAREHIAHEHETELA